MKKAVYRVAPSLYIANEYAAATKRILLERNIRSLVNCGFPQSISHYREEGFSYLSVPLVGSEEDDGLQYFRSVFDFIGTV